MSALEATHLALIGATFCVVTECLLVVWSNVMMAMMCQTMDEAALVHKKQGLIVPQILIVSLQLLVVQYEAMDLSLILRNVTMAIY